MNESRPSRYEKDTRPPGPPLDVPEELITLDGRELEGNPWIHGYENPGTSVPDAASASLSLRTPQLLWPLCAAAIVTLLYLASLLGAPARFRLDPTPGVVRLEVEAADGTMREVPCDGEGYFRLRPGSRRFSLDSGGQNILTRELTLKSDGSLYDGNNLFDFDRFAPRIVLDSGEIEAIPFVNGRKVEPKHRTLRLPAGRYDILLLSGRDLSDVISIELPAREDSLPIREFPWRFRDGSRSQQEKAVTVFFETLYALDPRSWEAYAPGKKSELVDFFLHAFCRTTSVPEQPMEDDADREDESFERRLVLLKDKIRQQLQNVIIQRDADGTSDSGGWIQLYRATVPWQDEAVGDWQYHYARALALLHSESYGDAKDEIEKGLLLAPEEADLHLGYGRILLHLGRFDVARKEIAEAIRLAPSLAAIGRIRLAEVDIREIEHRKNIPEAETVTALLQNALTLLDETIAGHTEKTEALFFRNLVFLGLGRQADSDDDWREFEKRISPENRALQIEKELERVRWKELFRDRQEVPEQKNPDR